jgi:hypothetical protein
LISSRPEPGFQRIVSLPHVPLGPRALARPTAGEGFPGPRQRPPCGRRGDRQACARPPGAAKDRCDRRRPEDQPPESCPPSTRGQANDQGRQAPPGPAAATPVAEDRDGRPDQPARPGDPGPFGAAGQPGLCPASSAGTVEGVGRRAHQGGETGAVGGAEHRERLGPGIPRGGRGRSTTTEPRALLAPRLTLRVVGQTPLVPSQ